MATHKTYRRRSTMKNDRNEGQAMAGVMVRKKEERTRIKTDEDGMKMKAFIIVAM